MSVQRLALRVSLPLAAAWLVLVGCESHAQRPVGAPVTRPTVASPPGVKAMTIKITSTAFAEGQPIPKLYTGEGKDLSPALAWGDLPPGTKELALICDDPDAAARSRGCTG